MTSNASAMIPSTEHDFMPLNSRHLNTLNGHVVLVLSTALNVLLLAVVTLEKNETLRAYSNVLRLNCTVDLLYTFICFITDYQADINEGRFVLALGGVFPRLSRAWNLVGVGAFLTIMFTSIFIIPVIFRFRYCLIVKRTQMTATRLLCAGLAAVAAAGVLAAEVVLALIYETSGQSCETALSHPMWTHGGYTVANCLITSATNRFTTIYVVTLGLFNTVIYSLMAYYTTVIFRTLHDLEVQYKERTSRLQRQMNVLLIFQLFLPVLCGGLPLLFVVVFIACNYNIAGAALLVMIVLSWIPLINPLLTIFLVTNFRRRVLRMLRAPAGHVTGGSNSVASASRQRTLTVY